MKILNKEEISGGGIMILEFGDTGVGKTFNNLATSPEPICYIATEPRSLKPTLDAIGRPIDVDVAIYEEWSGLMEFATNPKNFERYKTIILDSYSHLMTVGLSSEIEDQAYEARTEAEKQSKPLVSQVKMSMEGFGGLASHMFRLTAALGRLSRLGKIVIVICLLQESPKWDRELAAAPALKGREFPINMPGFFDLIGLVQTRTDADGNIIYPPLIRFRSPDNSFMAKFTGTGSKTEGPLNIKKILNIKE